MNSTYVVDCLVGVRQGRWVLDEREGERDTDRGSYTVGDIYICPSIQSVMGNALGEYVTRTTAIALREECANVKREKLVFFFFWLFCRGILCL